MESIPPIRKHEPKSSVHVPELIDYAASKTRNSFTPATTKPSNELDVHEFPILTLEPASSGMEDEGEGAADRLPVDLNEMIAVDPNEAIKAVKGTSAPPGEDAGTSLDPIDVAERSKGKLSELVNRSLERNGDPGGRQRTRTTIAENQSRRKEDEKASKRDLKKLQDLIFSEKARRRAKRLSETVDYPEEMSREEILLGVKRFHSIVQRDWECHSEWEFCRQQINDYLEFSGIPPLDWDPQSDESVRATIPALESAMYSLAGASTRGFVDIAGIAAGAEVLLSKITGNESTKVRDAIRDLNDHLDQSQMMTTRAQGFWSVKMPAAFGSVIPYFATGLVGGSLAKLGVKGGNLLTAAYASSSGAGRGANKALSYRGQDIEGIEMLSMMLGTGALEATQVITMGKWFKTMKLLNQGSKGGFNKALAKTIKAAALLNGIPTVSQTLKKVTGKTVGSALSAALFEMVQEIGADLGEAKLGKMVLGINEQVDLQETGTLSGIVGATLDLLNTAAIRFMGGKIRPGGGFDAAGNQNAENLIEALKNIEKFKGSEKALNEIDRALQAGEMDATSASAATYFVTEIDSNFDATTILRISDAAIEATEEQRREQGYDQPGPAYILGSFERQRNRNGKAIISLYRGHNADTVVEEWYHRAYEDLDLNSKAKFQAYHRKHHQPAADALVLKEDGEEVPRLPNMPVDEVFAQEGKEFFWTGKIKAAHEQGGITDLFGVAKNDLLRLAARADDLKEEFQGEHIDAGIREMYMEAGFERKAEAEIETEAEIDPGALADPGALGEPEIDPGALGEPAVAAAAGRPVSYHIGPKAEPGTPPGTPLQRGKKFIDGIFIEPHEYEARMKHVPGEGLRVTGSATTVEKHPKVEEDDLEAIVSLDQSDKKTLRKIVERVSWHKALGKIHTRTDIVRDIKKREQEKGLLKFYKTVDAISSAVATDATAEMQRGRKKKYAGSPAFVNSEKRRTKLRNDLVKVAEFGQRAKFWYEDSGKMIMKMVNFDRAAAERFVRVLAITSAQTQLSANWANAIAAWNLYKLKKPFLDANGKPTLSMNTTMAEHLDRALYKDQIWEGIKTNNFYFNLMRLIDPKGKGSIKKLPVTIDIHMMRAIGYKSSSPTELQFRWGERLIQDVAKQMGWEPQQAQAAIWVAQKYYRDVRPRVELGTLKNDPGVDVTTFADLAIQQSAMVTWEAVPHPSTNVLPGIHKAKFEERNAYTAQILEALQDENGYDILADLLDLNGVRLSTGTGFYQGDISPGRQADIVAPRGMRTQEVDGKLTPDIIRRLNVYSAILGKLLNQEAVAWHRPFFARSALKYKTTGAHYTINGDGFMKGGRELTVSEGEKIFNKLKEEFGDSASDIAIIPTADGVRFLNVTEKRDDEGGLLKDEKGNQLWGVSPKKFRTALAKAMDLALPKDDNVLSVDFIKEGDYIFNDWKESPNGEDYTSRISEEGFTDIWDRADSLLSPKIRQVNTRVAEQFGWDKAEVEAETQQAPTAAKEVTAPTTPLAEEAPRGPPEDTTPSKGKHPISHQIKAVDRKYMAAVEAGDTETAQKLVDAAAKKAGYKLEAEHQTWEQFSVFDAGEFGFHIGNLPEGMLGDAMRLRASITNPMRMEDLGVWTPEKVLAKARLRSRGAISASEQDEAKARVDSKQATLGDRLTDEYADEDYIDFRRAGYELSAPVRELLESKGYDGIVYRNEAEGHADSYIAFRSSQIKSADPITRDDAGNVIPLSERFQVEKQDIRYQIKAKPKKAKRVVGDVKPPTQDEDIAANNRLRRKVARQIEARIEGQRDVSWSIGPGSAEQLWENPSVGKRYSQYMREMYDIADLVPGSQTYVEVAQQARFMAENEKKDLDEAVEKALHGEYVLNRVEQMASLFVMKKHEAEFLNTVREEYSSNYDQALETFRGHLDRYVMAVQRSRTEIARDLSIGNAEIDFQYTLSGITWRVIKKEKGAKQKKLTPEAQKILEGIAKQLSAIDLKIAALAERTLGAEAARQFERMGKGERTSGKKSEGLATIQDAIGALDGRLAEVKFEEKTEAETEAETDVKPGAKKKKKKKTQPQTPIILPETVENIPGPMLAVIQAILGNNPNATMKNVIDEIYDGIKDGRFSRDDIEGLVTVTLASVIRANRRGGKSGVIDGANAIRAETRTATSTAKDVQDLVEPEPGTKPRTRDINTLLDLIARAEDQVSSGVIEDPTKQDQVDKTISLLEKQLKLARLKKKLRKQIEDLIAKLKGGKDALVRSKEEQFLDDEAERLLIERDKLRDDVDKKIHAMRDKTLLEILSWPFNLARTLMSSYDISATLRQGGILVAADPRRVARPFADQWNSLRSEDGFRKSQRDLERSKNWVLAKRSNLEMTKLDGELTDKEDDFRSTFAEKIPGVRASGRAYVAFLNSLRMNTFDTMIELVGRHGVVTDKQAKSLAHFINISTGRGGGKYAKSELASLLLWSPNLQSARIQYLFHGMTLGLTMSTKGTRKIIAKEYAKFAAMTYMIIGLASLFGADVEDDPRSSDFLKIKIGNTRFDMTTGLASYLRTLAQITVGKRKSLSTGELAKQDRLRITSRFLRGKLSPMPAILGNILAGKDVVGTPTTHWTVLQNLIPLTFMDMIDATKLEGLPMGSLALMSAIVGIGSSTFDPTDKKIAKKRDKAIATLMKDRSSVGVRKTSNLNPKPSWTNETLGTARGNGSPWGKFPPVKYPPVN